MKNNKHKIVPWAVAAGIMLPLGITLNVLAFNTFRDVLQMRFGTPTVVFDVDSNIEDIEKEGQEVSRNVAREGMVLLENNGTLPYTGSSKKVDLLGYHVANPFYGGSGSGAFSDTNEPVDFEKAFSDAGWTVNQNILNYYGSSDYETSVSAGFSIKEIDPNLYWDKTDSSADLAIISLGRSGGEGADLPTSGFGKDGTKSYLEMSDEEVSLITKASQTYKNVVVCINATNAIELGPIADLITSDKDSVGNIDALMWIGKPGYYGLTALEEIITGETNPSGKLTDTYAYDAFSSIAAKSFGNNAYTNLLIKGRTANESLSSNHHYQEYNENIYVGYKYYETASELGYLDYDSTILYPFGYGQSYTTFSWGVTKQSIPSSLKGDDKISLTVRVTNTGNKAGRDVVELYNTLDSAGLKSKKLDHSAATLIAFEKTGVIEPGKYEDVTFTFDAEDLASYDDKAVYTSNGGYVIENGDYTLSLRSDSHTKKDDSTEIKYNISKSIVYSDTSKDASADTSVSKRPTDLVSAKNAFGTYDASKLNGNKHNLEVPYLSITSSKEEWLGSISRKGNKEVTESLVNQIANGNNTSTANKDYEDHSDYAYTVKSGGTLNIKDFGEVDYDDPKWNELVNQMSISEMNKIITMGGYKTDKAESVGKEATVDSDGGTSLCYFADPAKYPGCAFPVTNLIGATWNKELAKQVGEIVGRECTYYGITGWYAPGGNIHRTPFSGRNFEYFSEDSALTAYMLANESSGATSKGVITYCKHYVLNDTETCRLDNVSHWTTEQALREVYVKGFEYAFKADRKLGLKATTGIMSSFMYAGDNWCAASNELLNVITRGELGFKGTVITDYYGGYNFMDMNCAVRGGNDLMLNTLKANVNLSKTSNDDIYYMQKACKNILYSYSRSSNVITPSHTVAGAQTWLVFAYTIDAIYWAGFAAVLFFLVKNIISNKKKVNE